MGTRALRADQEAILANWFTYHPPVDNADVARYQRIREAGLAFATVLAEETPSGPDLTASLRHVRDAVMTANAGIACADGPQGNV